ncbi:hypothetical protein AJ78_05285 [Emergomyces pasteurianus Ep9510]|uniref:Uncharacterized protein n=1 Tax=Emergomyces pasteurianus Ep9510 TaxID=1447872 RepID=A0A1J9PEA0_9EURO|nr:hypothetical protein AJ78_05285 [Emergomyces pasteurianus Ep9510]
MDYKAFPTPPGLGGTYTSAPDTPSPVFPDRLIRPLPKRPIRSRLSPEAAESILYPPAPPATQVFYGSYPGNGEVVNDAKVYVQQTNYRHDQSSEGDHRHPYDDGVDSGDEGGSVVVRRNGGFHRASLSPRGETRQKYVKHLEDTPTKMSLSGPDGYDAFENTNNKKKRKIPTSGNPGNHSNISADVAPMGITTNGGNSSSADDESGTGSYYGNGNPASPAGNGISGPGRGRYGRNAGRTVSGRTPLAAHNPNAWLGGRSGTGRKEVATSIGQESIGEFTHHSDQGIISAAIANAAALSSSAPRGQDNTSLLDQTRKPSPTKTQFTFTCESDSSKGMAWQAQHSYSIQQQHRVGNQPLSAMAPGQRGFSTQGTQTSPNMASQANHQGQAQGQHPSQGGQNATSGKKTRRSANSIYALAARQRRLQQQYANLHHPPNIDEIWICEFCEYESIFGRPPEALIRQYEIKDRKERRRLAEKRRLLEKAKMKGRKGKKATKNAAKAAAAQQSAHQQGYDRQHHPPNGDHDPAGQGGLGDDYLGDEYEDPVSAQTAHPSPPVPQSGVVKQAIPPSNHPKAGTGGTPTKGVAGGGTGRAG